MMRLCPKGDISRFTCVIVVIAILMCFVFMLWVQERYMLFPDDRKYPWHPDAERDYINQFYVTVIDRDGLVYKTKRYRDMIRQGMTIDLRRGPRGPRGYAIYMSRRIEVMNPLLYKLGWNKGEVMHTVNEAMKEAGW